MSWTAADLTIAQGKTLPDVIADASSCDSGAFDFVTDAWTLTFVMTGPTDITGAATGDALGVLTYIWQPGDTDIPGTYEAHFDGVRGDGKTARFPTSGSMTIVIEPA